MKARKVRTIQTKFNKKKSSNDVVHVELQMKCSCENTESDEMIQFSRRYLECHGSMPIGILRQFIRTCSCLSPKMKVLIIDTNGRVLNDSQHLASLRETSQASSYFHIPLRLIFINTVTGFGHCVCSSSIISDPSVFSGIIQSDTIDQILSTYDPVITKRKKRSSRWSKPSSKSMGNIPDMVLLPTPSPSSNDEDLSENMIHEITSTFGEICSQNETMEDSSSFESPLDLSTKPLCPTNLVQSSDT